MVIKTSRELEGLNVLVTGGAGFIGSHLIDALYANHAEICVIDNLSSGKMENITHPVNNIIGDVRDKDVFEKVGKVDLIFHEASGSMAHSFSDPTLDLTVNGVGTLNVLEYARKCDATLVHASTGSVYGNPTKSPVPENHPLNPTSPYGISKLVAEKYCDFYFKQYGLQVTCLRYFTVYGPRQRVDPKIGLIPILVSRLKNVQPPIIYGDGKQVRDFVNVNDVVNANLLAWNNKLAYGKAINVGSGKGITILKLTITVAKLCGGMREPTFLEAKKGEIRNIVADVSLARKLLGYKPQVTIETGIANYLQELKEGD